MYIMSELVNSRSGVTASGGLLCIYRACYRAMSAGRAWGGVGSAGGARGAHPRRANGSSSARRGARADVTAR